MRMRNFTWADLPALADLISLVRKAGGDDNIVSPSSLKEELAQPGLAPEENCTLLETGPHGPEDGTSEDTDGLIAYSVLHPELRIGRTVLEMGVHPAHREGGAEVEVIRQALARAKELGAKVLHICLPLAEFCKSSLGGEGFTEVRRYRTMRWSDGEVPPVNLPPEFDIESFRPGDAKRLTRLQNASFDGSWGFCSNTEEEVGYRVGMSICNPQGILFLTHGQDTAGYCWTYILGESTKLFGVIAMIGIDPGYRGRGLGKPILLAAMRYLHSRRVTDIRLSVDGENEAAIKLYTSVGFEKAEELHWFEARPSES